MHRYKIIGLLKRVIRETTMLCYSKGGMELYSVCVRMSRLKWWLGSTLYFKISIGKNILWWLCPVYSFAWVRMLVDNRSCRPSTPEFCEKYFASSDLRPLPTRICLHGANMGTIITRRRWRWIGHVIGEENELITKTHNIEHLKAGAVVAGPRKHDDVPKRRK